MKSITLRWCIATPLGVPVEPEVLMMHSGSVSMTCARRAAIASASVVTASSKMSSTRSTWSTATPSVMTDASNACDVMISAGWRLPRMFFTRCGGDFTSKFE